MQTLRQKPWLVAVATLVIGVAIGLGVSTVTSRSGHASAAANTAAATSHDSTKSDVLDPFSEMERMQADIDRAIRRATDSFRLAPGSDLLRRDLGFSSALDVRDRKDHF